ncbi:LolA family protein [Pseudorhodobacter ferrugineus]|uniref:LolA family protein n=1 Tax=Pseudorhodobacter ferrugineus TaxID=77008 RepID=UPI0003B37889|nr:outer membrane lipoprotein carrier protein LolA [Pseudorhodobacter ferrugineus]
MNRRSFIRSLGLPFAAMALLTALAIPAAAEKISLKEISRYLNGLTTAQAEFTQINADGSISTGTLYIQRPGRARFEYNPPDKNLVLASSGTVAIFDAKSNQPPEQYPLSRTPLSIILANNVDLGRAKMVVGHSVDGNTTRVRAQDPEHPEYGSIEMVFTSGPTELRQWVIRDDSGGETTVILGEMQKGGRLKAALFNIGITIEQRK